MQDSANAKGAPSLTMRLIAVLWNEEAVFDDSTDSGETALAVLRRRSKEIHRLVRLHTLFLYSINAKVWPVFTLKRVLLLNALFTHYY